MPAGIILTVIILIFSIIIHEVAHGWMANHLGDPTARLQGRLTLNPVPHIDLVGSIILPGFLVLSGSPVLFGWAKPVPYNPYNLQHRWGELLVAAVGPLSNILLAVIAGLLLRSGLLVEAMPLLQYTILINCALAIFNLIPIPPLDGSKILFELLPTQTAGLREVLERSGFLLVFIFIIFGWSLIAPLILGLARLIGGF